MFSTIRVLTGLLCLQSALFLAWVFIVMHSAEASMQARFRRHTGCHTVVRGRDFLPRAPAPPVVPPPETTNPQQPPPEPTFSRRTAVAPAPITLGLNVLVLAGHGDEPELESMLAALKAMNVPYGFRDAAGVYHSAYITEAFPAGSLTDAILYTTVNGVRKANFSAILQTNRTCGYSNFQTGAYVPQTLSQAEMDRLDAYQDATGVRRVFWSVYPEAALGFNPPTGAKGLSSTQVLPGYLTTAGKSIFPDIFVVPASGRPANPIKISNTYVYLAQPTNTVSMSSLVIDQVPVNRGTLTEPDWVINTNAGAAVTSTLCGIYTKANGAQSLVLTFATNPQMEAHQLLASRLVNWATTPPTYADATKPPQPQTPLQSKGLHMGDFQVMLTSQIDDLFLASTLYPAVDDENTLPSSNYRISNVDLADFANCQTRTNTETQILVTRNWPATTPTLSGFEHTFAFNGSGADLGSPTGIAFDPYLPEVFLTGGRLLRLSGQEVFEQAGNIRDPLTVAVKTTYKDTFWWENHTWDHQELDTVTRHFAANEIWLNGPRISSETYAADVLWGPNNSIYHTDEMVNPGITGINNGNCLGAFWDNNYIVGRTYTGPKGACYCVGDTSVPAKSSALNPGFLQYRSASTTYTRSDLVRLNVAPPAVANYVLVINRFPTSIYYNVREPVQAVTEWLKMPSFAGATTTYYDDLKPRFPNLPNPSSLPTPPGATASVPMSTYSASQLLALRNAYNALLEYESDNIVKYMLTFDRAPLMFHQANCSSYDRKNGGTWVVGGVNYTPPILAGWPAGYRHSLLSDLMWVCIIKYKKKCTLPILSLRQDVLGPKIYDVMAYRTAMGFPSFVNPAATCQAPNIDATLTLTPGRAGGVIKFAVPNVTTIRPIIKVPVTGLPANGRWTGTQNGIPILPGVSNTVYGPYDFAYLDITGGVRLTYTY